MHLSTMVLGAQHLDLIHYYQELISITHCY